MIFFFLRLLGFSRCFRVSAGFLWFLCPVFCTRLLFGPKPKVPLGCKSPGSVQTS